MAFAPPIDHNFYAKIVNTTAGGGTLIASGTTIATSQLVTYDVRCWVFRSTPSATGCVYLRRAYMAINLAGTLTPVSPVITTANGGFGTVSNAATPVGVQQANPQSHLGISSEDAAMSLDFTVSGTTIRIEANQANATSRTWVILANEVRIQVA